MGIADDGQEAGFMPGWLTWLFLLVVRCVLCGAVLVAAHFEISEARDSFDGRRLGPVGHRRHAAALRWSGTRPLRRGVPGPFRPVTVRVRADGGAHRPRD